MRHAETTRLEAFSDGIFAIAITASFRFGWIPWLITTLLALFVPSVAMAGIGLLTVYWMIFPGRRRRHA